MQANRDRTNDNQVQWYTYDALDRLTRGYTESQGEGYDEGRFGESYAYNPVGNINSKGGSSYTYGNAAHVHALAQAWSTVIACDLNVNALKELSWRKGSPPFRISLNAPRCRLRARP